MRQLGGFGDRNSIKRTKVSTGVKSNDPVSVLNEAVLCFNARAFDGDVLREGGVITANAGYSYNTRKPDEKFYLWMELNWEYI